MSDNAVDQGKRTWLITTSCAGAVGGVAAAVPFVSTFAPSERAKAAGAPVEADIGALKPGEKMTFDLREKMLEYGREQQAAWEKRPHAIVRASDEKN